MTGGSPLILPCPSLPVNQLDSEGNLVPLSDLPAADRRVIAVAANSILDRAFGKPKSVEEPKDDIDARLKAMTSAERLAYARELLEGARKDRAPGGGVRAAAGSRSPAGLAGFVRLPRRAA